MNQCLLSEAEHLKEQPGKTKEYDGVLTLRSATQPGSEEENDSERSKQFFTENFEIDSSSGVGHQRVLLM